MVNTVGDLVRLFSSIGCDVVVLVKDSIGF